MTSSVLQKGSETTSATVRTSHDLHIQGLFTGNVVSESTVFIDTDAIFRGNVVADRIEVAGTFEGGCFAKHALKLVHGCRVNGKVYYGELIIEPGATFSGESCWVKPESFKNAIKDLKELKDLKIG